MPAPPVARLRDLTQARGFPEIAVRTKYDPALVDGIKQAFSYRDRRWDAGDKVWLVAKGQQQALIALLGRHGYTVEWDHTLLDPKLDPDRPCYDVELVPAPEGLISTVAPPIGRADLSPDQATVFDAVLAWLDDPNGRQYLTLGGLAGTGKSTIVSALVGALPPADGFMTGACCIAYTGKAAGVLRDKLTRAGLITRVAYCGTIHGLVFKPIVDQKTGRVTGWIRRDKSEVLGNLLIVDEASMVGGEAWEALLSFDMRVLAVGDHGQLPPVEKSALNVVANPDLRLEQIHRQAEGSPILALAHHVRQGGHIGRFQVDGVTIRRARSFPEIADEFVAAVDAADAAGRLGAEGTMTETALLCYFNKTRVALNAIVREKRGLEGPLPDPGDVVICLRNMGPVMYNGMRGLVVEVGSYDPDRYGRIPMTVFAPDERLRVRGLFHHGQFGREGTIAEFTDLPGHPYSWNQVGLLYDFGYALTVHKSQGSQFRDVGLVIEGGARNEDLRRRWQYTAVTRAVERLWLIG